MRGHAPHCIAEKTLSQRPQLRCGCRSMTAASLVTILPAMATGVLRCAEEVHRSVEEALAVQEAARRAMAGKSTQSATAHAGADDSHRADDVQRRDEHAEAEAETEHAQERPAPGPTAAEPERPHVGLAEVTELPEVSLHTSCIRSVCRSLKLAIHAWCLCIS